MTETKPYRPNVGVALFNAFGHVLIGRRFRDDGPEIVLPGLEWQMPQGGIEQTKIRARQRCANSGKRPAQSMLNISMRPKG